MKKYNILFSPPDITEQEIQEVAEALRSGWITTGPRTKKLEKQIADETERSKEIEDLETYTKTKKYVEDVAKEKLGLVYEDEILFKASGK